MFSLTALPLFCLPNIFDSSHPCKLYSCGGRFCTVPCRQQNWVALNRVVRWLLLSCGGWYHFDIIRGVIRRGAIAVVTCNAVGCYRLEQVVCVLQLTCVNCTRWTHAPVLCATACTVTCPTCGSTCA